MPNFPEFPQFKPIQLEDRKVIHPILKAYQPRTSEWTFSNLFIWRSRYHFRWCLYQDWLLTLCEREDQRYALEPIGPPCRLEVTRKLLAWMRQEWKDTGACIERADQRLVAELDGASDLIIEPTRDHFDYVYRSEDLIRLAGRKYHSKRNHIRNFHHTTPFSYSPLRKEHVKPCFDLAELWCTWRRCEDDLNLTGETAAIREALNHFLDLEIQGGVILIDHQVKAFALGEMVNDETAVVHIEKADPEIHGLYAVINQQFCENHWQGIPYINREQDLGEPGLRQAKLSYYPDHFAEKYRITLDIDDLERNQRGALDSRLEGLVWPPA